MQGTNLKTDHIKYCHQELLWKYLKKANWLNSAEDAWLVLRGRAERHGPLTRLGTSWIIIGIRRGQFPLDGYDGDDSLVVANIWKQEARRELGHIYEEPYISMRKNKCAYQKSICFWRNIRPTLRYTHRMLSEEWPRRNNISELMKVIEHSFVWVRSTFRLFKV
jgi:hypothetical protein